MNRYTIICIRITLLALLGGLTLSMNAHAQSSTLIAAKTISVCPSGFEQFDEQKLCVSNKFSKPAFKKKRPRQQCPDGFAKVTGVRQCIIDRKTSRLTMRGEYLVISKSEKTQCGSNYRRASKSNVCLDKQLALNVHQGKLVLEKQVSLNCLASNDKSCSSLCRPGYLKPLGMDMCVAFNLAKQGNPGLRNPEPECAGSSDWHKINANGLCIPARTLIASSTTGPTGKLAVVQGDFECPDAQVVIVQLPSGDIQFQTQVIICSYPGVGKAG